MILIMTGLIYTDSVTISLHHVHNIDLVDKQTDRHMNLKTQSPLNMFPHNCIKHQSA